MTSHHSCQVEWGAPQSPVRASRKPGPRKARPEGRNLPKPGTRTSKMSELPVRMEGLAVIGRLRDSEGLSGQDTIWSRQTGHAPQPLEHHGASRQRPLRQGLVGMSQLASQ